MKYVISLIFLSLFLANSITAQDLIKKNDGSKVKCKITSVDSLTIYFDFPIGETSFFSSSIDLKSVSSYTYMGQTTLLKEGKLMSVSDEPLLIEIPENPLKILADSIELLNKYFIYTYSGEIMFGERISYEIKLLEMPYFIYNEQKISPGKVKFFKNEMGFNANTKDLNYSGTSDFATRITKGRINLYEMEKITYFNSASRNFKYFYNIGFDDVKKVNYRNLIIDLSSNPESMTSLKEYKSLSNIQTILYVAGGAILTGGFVTLISKDLENPNVTPNLIAIGVGAGCIVVGVTFSIPKLEHLEDAIDAFNN